MALKHLVNACALASLMVVIFAAVPVFAGVPIGASQIQHIVFILKENHTLDNYFGEFPGVDGASTGKLHDGRTVALGPASNFFDQDIGHSFANALTAINGGEMDGFDLLPGAIEGGRLIGYTQFDQSQIPNYWALASRFVLADEFFTSVHGPSFPNHLFTIAAQSGGASERSFVSSSDAHSG